MARAIVNTEELLESPKKVVSSEELFPKQKVVSSEELFKPAKKTISTEQLIKKEPKKPFHIGKLISRIERPAYKILGVKPPEVGEPEPEEEIRGRGGLAALRTLRWPFWRAFEHPVATIATEAQEKRLGTGTLARAAESLVPFRKVQHPKFYEDFWKKNWEDKVNTPAPGWYTGLASLASAMAIEIPLIRGIDKVAKRMVTKGVTPQDATRLQKTIGDPIRQNLKNIGVDASKLSDKGSVITLQNGQEITLSPDAVQFLKGKPPRIFKWQQLRDLKKPGVIKGEAPLVPKLAPPAKVTPVPEVVPTPSVVKGVAPLVAEAKKFKTAEEFVESQKKEIIAPDEVKQAFENAPQKIKGLIDVKRIRFVDDLGGEGGRYEANSKTIFIEKGEDINETIIHETGHNIIEKFSKEDKPFVQSYIEKIFKGRPLEVTDNYLKALKNAADDNFVRGLGGYVNTVEERMSDDIATYLINPDKLPKEIKTLFDEHFGVVESQLTDIWKKAQKVPPTIVRGVVPPEVPPAGALVKQIKQAHIIAREKALITPEGKTRPGYRRLAMSMTGKKSMRDMTQEEAVKFIDALKRISEPVFRKGKLVPPSIPKTTRVVPEGFFKREFKEPTIMRYVTSQTYYSELLGVKPLVEPLEIAKQKFDLSYRGYSSNVDKMIAKINKLGGVTSVEAIKAKVKNIPTRAISKMRDLLDKYEEAPAFLSSEDKEVFNWFRSLNRTVFEGENVVRKSLGLEPIKYRKAYVRHTAETMAKEMLLGKYPFPQGLKYWSQKVVGKKIFNPMEFQRKLADDLENLWTKDLGHATKSMLWTGLKEIHLSQPLKFLNEQLGALSKDPLVYKNMTLEEREIYDQQMTIPASTKKWLIDYVNVVIKGQETDLDASINRLVTNSGLKGLFNKFLAPFGRTVSRKPITEVFQTMGRLTIHGVMGPIRPKQLIRNKFQLTQNLALYTLKANLKGFFPATKQMKELMSDSLFLKTYTGFEELPTNIQGKLEKLNLALFQWTAVSNVSQSMKVAYWDTLDLIENSKYKDLGWADPKRTYKEPSEFLYPSEREKILREMEFGAGITQYGYIPMAMPEVFRHKALIPFTRLQSWWMNHFFKFNREAIMRGIKGETGYGTKLPWSRRLAYLRYLILGGAILNTLDYERSFLFGAAPSGLPPTAQFMLGLYTFLLTSEKTAWGRRKKADAKRRMFYAMKTFVPGYLAWKDFNALMSGEKQLEEYFFYKKIEKKKGLGITPLKGISKIKLLR